MKIETKEQAKDLFGGKVTEVAKAYGCSRSAVYQWPEQLTQECSDRLMGAAVRLGKVKVRKTKGA